MLRSLAVAASSHQRTVRALADYLASELQADRVDVGAGQYAGDPFGAVSEACNELDAAAASEALHAALRRAQDAAAGLTTREG